MKLPAGSRLGPYEVDALIGTGGMGAVYRARDTRLNRDVALKVLDPTAGADVDHVTRFEREARTTALVNHPNVVSVYDTGSDNGLPFVVTELLRGETLRSRIKRGAVSVRGAIGIATDIARGLTAAHGHNVVHRDLKPENVFLTQDGRAKILDFGLAKCPRQSVCANEDASTRVGTVLGTVGYMSPEQVLGAATDARSDIFSLGVILHELLSGVAPFHGDSAIETLHAILKDDAPALPSRAGISEQLQRVVQRCLEKKADARFQSAGDLAFVLEFMLPPSKIVSASPRSSVARAVLAAVLSFL